MLQIAMLREQPELVVAGLTKKNYPDPQGAVDELLKLDEQRREVMRRSDELAAEANAAAKQVGDLMKQGRKDEAEAIRAQTTAAKQRIAEVKEELDALDQQFQDRLIQLPNLPHASVPNGTHADHNEVVYQVDSLPELGHMNGLALPHWDLLTKHNLVDFELGVKIAGAGFPVYRGKGARLQRALLNFFLDRATAAGYEEIEPPILINEASGYGTGQLPDKEGQMYHVTIDDLYLIPTAEVPVTNMFRDVILKEDDFPVRCTAYTPCFRREAGSYGAHVRGLNRLHQFDKVEIVQLTHPDRSYEVLEGMSAYVQGLLRDLGLPYRVLRLCGGDMSFASALTYDMEVWSAGQGRWLEVSSVSNFETFQANRMQLRYKPSVGGKNQLAHTLNGSALALPRIVAALLENNQNADGTVSIPEVLWPYTGFEQIG